MPDIPQTCPRCWADLDVWRTAYICGSTPHYQTKDCRIRCLLAENAALRRDGEAMNALRTAEDVLQFLRERSSSLCIAHEMETLASAKMHLGGAIAENDYLIDEITRRLTPGRMSLEEEKMAADRPAWHSNPTCPGCWVMRHHVCGTSIVYERSDDYPAEDGWRFYGPIPEEQP